MNTAEILHFLKQHLGNGCSLNLIKGSASDRNNYEVIYHHKRYILTVGLNLKENETFVKFVGFFASINAHTPKIIVFCEDKSMYLQEYVGSDSLLDCLKNEGESDNMKTLYKLAINQLITLQIEGKNGINPKWCYDFSNLNALTVLHDLFYFKNLFLDLLNISYSRKLLLEDFNFLAKTIENSPVTTFIHRDFQARNIMIHNNEAFVIDFQGGMIGLPLYDLVSLCTQSRANLSEGFQVDLKEYYLNEFNLKSTEKFTPETFTLQYNLCWIVRQLQTLGAYGFRGIFQKKPQFVASISQSLNNLNSLLELELMEKIPELKRVLNKLHQISELDLKSILHGIQ